MSIASLCQDEVTIYSVAIETDEQFGATESYTAELPARKSFVQEMNAATRKQYDIPAIVRAYMIFFPADPGDLTNKLIGYEGIYLRPLGGLERHSPGRGLQLWAVAAEFVGNRQQTV